MRINFFKKTNLKKLAVKMFDPKIMLLISLHVGALFLGAAGAWGYNYPGYKWGASSVSTSSSVSYILDSATLTSTWRTAIRSADATWDGASANSAFRFNYTGTYNSTNSSPAYPYVYASNAGNNGAPATTWTTHTSTTISWCYTRINTYYPYSIGGSATTYDLRSDMTHEFGHWLYLGHVTSTASPTYCSTSSTAVNTSEATMCPYSELNRTHKRTLNSDDINGISYIY